MITCPFCSGAIDGDSSFCTQCGRSISALGAAGSRDRKRWIVSASVAAVIILTGAVGLWASPGGNAGWISAKLGLSKGTAVFPATAFAGGCCASGGGGKACGGDGCAADAGNISDDEAYQAATSVFSYWASLYDQNDLRVEVLNKRCHAEIKVLLKNAPLKSYRYANGNITAI